jgi:hypothetical protein
MYYILFEANESLRLLAAVFQIVVERERRVRGEANN